MTSPVDRLTTALTGRYEIERELGQGGMATVYLAQDVRHHRKVALKVLRPELSAILGGDRFLHEIRTTANLQHPHILPLYDSGEADGLVFYVMPFVAGESLRDRLARETQLPVEDAVCIAKEVADALDYAHRHGVIHRDIKPENILLHDARAQVADFGIALAVSSAGGGTRMTETGMSLGTPHYMSPEQAMGEREISAKSDIYALGCVLYEMLVGEPPFTGPSAQAIIARVVTEEPRSLTLQRKSIPEQLESVVRRALEKLPADRFQSAAQFGQALTDPDSVLLAAQRNRTTTARAAARNRWRPSGLLVPVLGALLLIATVAAAWGWMRPRPEIINPVVRFPISVDETVYSDPIYNNADGRSIAMSAAGDYFIYGGRNQQGEVHLFRRSLDALESVVVPGTRGGTGPFLSPDGRWLGFFQYGKVQKVAVTGGPVLTVATADSGFRGATWGPDDVIVVATHVGLRTVPAAGGRLAFLTALDTRSEVHRLPEFLPDGRAVLFQRRDSAGMDHPAAVDLKSGVVKHYGEVGSDPRYVESGYVLLSSLTGIIAAVPFDASSLEFTGDPIPVLEGVSVGTGGAARMGVSRRGALIYSKTLSGARSLVMVDRKGAVQPIPAEMRQYWSPRYSPDGRRIALEVGENVSNSIWTFDVAQKSLTRLTFEGTAGRPFWTPDGSRVAYSLGGRGPGGAVASVRADGSSPPEPLLPADGGQIQGDDWSRDGRTLVYHETVGGNNDIMLAGLDSGSRRVHYLKSPAHEGAPAVSPDGRWLAYFSDESGRSEVYVRSFPIPGGKTQVSLTGGAEPRWSRDGRELFYRNGDRMMAATVRSQPDFVVLQRVELFSGRFAALPFFAQYDVAPDGKHFVMIQAGASSGDLMVVLNWFDQLRGKRGGTRQQNTAEQ